MSTPSAGGIPAEPKGELLTCVRRGHPVAFLVRRPLLPLGDAEGLGGAAREVLGHAPGLSGQCSTSYFD